MKVWFGGYTSHDSKGIYTADAENNGNDIKLDNVKNIVELDRPTYFQSFKMVTKVELLLIELKTKKQNN